jgi:hypothetical protein
MQTEERTYKKNQQITVRVVHGYSLRRNDQQQRKQGGRYENKENKSKSTSPKSAINNMIKERTVKGTKHCYKPNILAMLHTKYT